MKEVEVKVLNINTPEILTKLADATKTFEGDVYSYYYRHTTTQKKVRIRKMGDKTIITHKRKIQDKRAKINEETEIIVDSFEETKKLFEALGFEQVKVYEKKRTSFEYMGGHVEIETFTDQYSFVPTFLEIEAQTYAKVVEIAHKLGFDESELKAWNGAQVIDYYENGEDSNVLFHGSPNTLIGDTLNPSQGDDSEERPENNQFGVYATDRKDLAIVMGILGCKDVIGGSIDEYQDDKLNARIYGEYPQQEYIYIYHLPVQTFNQTNIDKHQFVSLVAVKPIKVEKVKVKDYTHLIRKATKEETDYWMKKYGN